MPLIIEFLYSMENVYSGSFCFLPTIMREIESQEMFALSKWMETMKMGQEVYGMGEEQQ